MVRSQGANRFDPALSCSRPFLARLQRRFLRHFALPIELYWTRISCRCVIQLCSAALKARQRGRLTRERRVFSSAERACRGLAEVPKQLRSVQIASTILQLPPALFKTAKSHHIVSLFSDLSTNLRACPLQRRLRTLSPCPPGRVSPPPSSANRPSSAPPLVAEPLPPCPDLFSRPSEP
jgi:hypothetical protein